MSVLHKVEKQKRGLDLYERTNIKLRYFLAMFPVSLSYAYITLEDDHLLTFYTGNCLPSRKCTLTAINFTAAVRSYVPPGPHQPGAYTGLGSMKRNLSNRGISTTPFPSEGHASPSQGLPQYPFYGKVYPSTLPRFASTLFTTGWREAIWE